jgi:hypothetical protein
VLCAAPLLALAATACGEDLNEQVAEDSGSLCLTQTGDQIGVFAVPEICLGNCRKATESGCRAKVDSGRIVVSSRVVTVDSGAETCTTACDLPRLECEFTAPSDGMQTIAYGDEEATLLLPLTVPTPVFGGQNVCPVEDQ